MVAQIRESIATFGLTVAQLFGRSAKASKTATRKTTHKAAAGDTKGARKGAGVAKYRDPKTGKTWTGFGKPPGWLAKARSRDRFLIDQSGVTAAPAAESTAAPVAAAVKKAARKARVVAAPMKTATLAEKVAHTAVAMPPTKVEAPIAKKAASKKGAASKKTAVAKKAVSAPKAAAKSPAKPPKKTAVKVAGPKAAAKTRSARKSENTAKLVVPVSATQPTEASASAA